MHKHQESAGSGEVHTGAELQITPWLGQELAQALLPWWMQLLLLCTHRHCTQLRAGQPSGHGTSSHGSWSRSSHHLRTAVPTAPQEAAQQHPRCPSKRPPAAEPTHCPWVPGGPQEVAPALFSRTLANGPNCLQQSRHRIRTFPV